MEKICSKCSTPFNCQNETNGCWCEAIQLSQEMLDYLNEHYVNCLCPTCLITFEEGGFSQAGSRFFPRSISH